MKNLLTRPFPLKSQAENLTNGRLGSAWLSTTYQAQRRAPRQPTSKAKGQSGDQAGVLSTF